VALPHRSERTSHAKYHLSAYEGEPYPYAFFEPTPFPPLPGSGGTRSLLSRC
jgi:hypothetical protein